MTDQPRYSCEHQASNFQPCQICGGTAEDEPQDPISAAAKIAIGWNEGLMALINAGFTRREAFLLLHSQWDAYWTETYGHLFDNCEDEK